VHRLVTCGKITTEGNCEIFGWILNDYFTTGYLCWEWYEMYKYTVWAIYRALVLEKMVHIITTVISSVASSLLQVPFLSSRVVLCGALLSLIVMGWVWAWQLSAPLRFTSRELHCTSFTECGIEKRTCMCAEVYRFPFLFVRISNIHAELCFECSS